MFFVKTPKIGGFVVDRNSIDLYHKICGFVVDRKQKHRFINKICSKTFKNAIGIGARAFRCDYERGGVFYEGGVKDGGTLLRY